MNRKIIPLLLAVWLVLSLAVSVSAAPDASGTCGDNAQWHYANGTLTISGTGGTYDYQTVMDNVTTAPWSGFAEEITALIIQDGITEIGEQNFRGLSKLQHISFADSVTRIGPWSFWGCEAMESIDLPSQLTGIGQEAFKWCIGLRSIEIPATVTYLGGGIFDFCTGLKQAYFHSDPDLPGMMVYYSLFSNCRSLERIDVEEGHIILKSIDGVLYIYEEASGDLFLTNYPIGCRNTEFRIPDGTVEVGQFSIQGNPYLETVVFPDSVTEVAEYALSGCSNLKTVRFEGNAPVVFGTNVFQTCQLTVYYPVGDPSWDAIISMDDSYFIGGQIIGGNPGSIEWVPYDPSNPFLDVPLGTFYEAPVLWAVENGITNGASHTSFNPNGQCLRAQVVTFLHRTLGNTEPAVATNPFTDVKASDYFYKSVLWAVENGITIGISGTEFGAYASCNRAAVVTFLWRAAGSPEPALTAHPFTDIPAGAFYEKAVLWAMEKGITNGISATEFGPSTVCNRAQVVTFLYRAYH